MSDTRELLREVFASRFPKHEPDERHLELIAEIEDLRQKLALVDVDRQSWLQNRSTLREHNELLRDRLREQRREISLREGRGGIVDDEDGA